MRLVSANYVPAWPDNAGLYTRWRDIFNLAESMMVAPTASTPADMTPPGEPENASQSDNGEAGLDRAGAVIRDSVGVGTSVLSGLAAGGGIGFAVAGPAGSVVGAVLAMVVAGIAAKNKKD
jgi:hypothetical protein